MSENLSELNEISFEGFLPPELNYQIDSESQIDGKGYVRQFVWKVRSVMTPNPGITSKFPNFHRNHFEVFSKMREVGGGVREENSILSWMENRFDKSPGLRSLLQSRNIRACKTKNDFLFNGDIVERFKWKGLLITKANKWDEQSYRRARVHAIASGADQVLPVVGLNRFIFVNSVDKLIRAKRILERLGYTSEALLFRFEPEALIHSEDDSTLIQGKKEETKEVND